MSDMRQVNVRVNEYFGDEQIPLSFPDGWKVNLVEMACKDAPPLDDEEIRSALDNSEGAPSITEQARGKKGRIVVTCDDLSRPTPAYRVFPFIVEQLHEAGISDSQIFVLGSFGCHHPMNLDSYARKLGEWAVAKYDCARAWGAPSSTTEASRWGRHGGAYRASTGIGGRWSRRRTPSSTPTGSPRGTCWRIATGSRG